MSGRRLVYDDLGELTGMRAFEVASVAVMTQGLLLYGVEGLYAALGWLVRGKVQRCKPGVLAPPPRLDVAESCGKYVRALYEGPDVYYERSWSVKGWKNEDDKRKTLRFLRRARLEEKSVRPQFEVEGPHPVRPGRWLCYVRFANAPMGAVVLDETEREVRGLLWPSHR